MPFSKRQSHRQKRIKQTKIPVTVNNITKQQLDTLMHELVLFLAPSFTGGLLVILLACWWALQHGVL